MFIKLMGIAMAWKTYMITWRPMSPNNNSSNDNAFFIKGCLFSNSAVINEGPVYNIGNKAQNLPKMSSYNENLKQG